MSNSADRIVRVAADLMESAAAEGARQGRSAEQQLDHWARAGRAVSDHQIGVRRRAEAAFSGHPELCELNVEQGALLNATIAATIREQLTKTNYGSILADRGVTTVALDDNGDIVQHQPDGSSTVLTARRHTKSAKSKR